MVKKLTYDEVYELFAVNGYELLEKEYHNIRMKMRFKCPKHPKEETLMNVEDIRRGMKCQFCKMEKYNIENIREEFKLRNYNLLEEKYISAKTKMAFICLKHPEKTQYISYDCFHNRGNGCKVCGREVSGEKQRYSIEYIKKEFRKRNYILIEKTYINNRQKLRYLCPLHTDKETYITFSDLQQGVGCPYCNVTNKLNYNEVKLLFEQNNFILLEEEYKERDIPMKCICNYHPNYIQYVKISNLKRNSGCQYCSGRKATFEKSLGYLYEELTHEWHQTKNKISPYEVFPKSNKHVWWKCSVCDHEWECRIADRTGKHSNCPSCNESKGEKRIREFFKLNKIQIISQKEFNGLIGIRGGNLSYDFYLPKFNMLIEYQGEQHDRFIKGIHGDKNGFKRQQEHDRRKREYAEQHGIKLIEIWYWDFDNIEKILKDKIINLVV